MAVSGPRADQDEPIIPGIEGITDLVRDSFRESEDQQLFQTLMDHFAVDEHGPPNVEDLLTHVRSLRSVAGNDMVRGLTATNLDKLDIEISKSVVRAVNKSLRGNDTPYHKLAAWIGAIPRTHPIEIFTPNYDLLMEQALEDTMVPYFDGFVGSRRAFFDAHSMEEDVLPPRWARIWKLHGSINWIQGHDGVVYRGDTTIDNDPPVIHPSHLKYDKARQMPYVAMIERLRRFLRQPSAVLMICGYSFRDDHLNASMSQGIQGNPTAAIFALLHGNIADYSQAISLAKSRANVSILAKDRALIGTRQARWTNRRSNDNGLSSSAITWEPDPTNSEIHQARFMLGDFMLFGRFIEEVIGSDYEETKE